MIDLANTTESASHVPDVSTEASTSGFPPEVHMLVAIQKAKKRHALANEKAERAQERQREAANDLAFQQRAWDRVQEYEKEIRDIREEVERYKQVIASSQKELAAKDMELNQRELASIKQDKKEIADLKEEVARYKEIVKKSQKTLARSIEEVKNSNREVMNSNKEVAKYKEEVANSKQEIAKYKKEVANSRQEIAKYKEKVEKANQETVRYKEEGTKYKDLYEEESTSHEVKCIKIDKLVTSNEQKFSDLIVMENALKNLQETHNTLQSRLDATIKNHDKVAKELVEVNNDRGCKSYDNYAILLVL